MSLCFCTSLPIRKVTRQPLYNSIWHYFPHLRQLPLKTARGHLARVSWPPMFSVLCRGVADRRNGPLPRRQLGAILLESLGFGCLPYCAGGLLTVGTKTTGGLILLESLGLQCLPYCAGGLLTVEMGSTTKTARGHLARVSGPPMSSVLCRGVADRRNGPLPQRQLGAILLESLGLRCLPYCAGGLLIVETGLCHKDS